MVPPDGHRAGARLSVATRTVLIDLLTVRGEVLGRIADYERAAELAERLVRDAPDNGRAWLARAKTRAVFHRFTGALSDLETAERNGMDRATVDAERAPILQAVGCYWHALVLCGNAVKHRPGFTALGALAVLQFAGVLASQGHLNLTLVIIIGTLAELAGAYASYAVGRAGGKPLVRRLGRYVLVTESDVDRAERFLEGRGAWAIPVGRMLPFVRAFTSIVAGLARVPAVRFGILSLIGTVVYPAAVASAGYGLGSAWQRVSHGLSVLGYVLFALVVVAAAVGFIAVRRVRRSRGYNRSRAP